MTILQYRWDPSPLYAFFALQSTITVKKVFTVTLNFIPAREIRHQYINNYLQTVLVQGEKSPGFQLRGFYP
jgi:hypothetical protein